MWVREEPVLIGRSADPKEVRMKLVVVLGDADGVDKEVTLETVGASAEAEKWLREGLGWAVDASTGPAGDGNGVNIVSWRLA